MIAQRSLAAFDVSSAMKLKLNSVLSSDDVFMYLRQTSFRTNRLRGLHMKGTVVRSRFAARDETKKMKIEMILCLAP